MLDAAVRRLLASPVDRLAGSMTRVGINPNTITIFGFLMGLGAAFFIADQQYAKGVFFLALNRFADILDGILARTKGQTALGGFLDAALDLLVYAVIPLAFALARQQDALAAMFLLVGVVVAAIPVLAFRAVAQKPDELLVICGHSETFIALTLMCLAERWAFTPLAYFYGSLCFLSSAVSIVSAIVKLRAARRP
jgi:phosphatidylglycerophosphate synthase